MAVHKPVARARRRLLNASVRHRSRVARWLLGGHASISFSQEGEDRVLNRLLEREGPGFYVDVGAHDPRRFSNTYLLYLAGWRGIAVDPHHSTAEAFRQIRPRDVFLETAVGTVAGNHPYFEFNDSALNTLSRARADNLVESTDYVLVRESTVPVQRLDWLLSEHLPPGQQIGVMSVDTEGADEDVLTSNDWDCYRPRFVIVEILGLTSLIGVEASGAGRRLMDNGYVPFAKALNSVFFADRSSDGAPRL